jgi:hypothetical protein
MRNVSPAESLGKVIPDPASGFSYFFDCCEESFSSTVVEAVIFMKRISTARDLEDNEGNFGIIPACDSYFECVVFSNGFKPPRALVGVGLVPPSLTWCEPFVRFVPESVEEFLLLPEPLELLAVLCSKFPEEPLPNMGTGDKLFVVFLRARSEVCESELIVMPPTLALKRFMFASELSFSVAMRFILIFSKTQTQSETYLRTRTHT